MMDADHSRVEAWQTQQDSVLFRRGMNMASADGEFLDIVFGLKEVSQNKDNIDLLVVGVARGQEPLSLLVVLNSIAQKKGKTVEDFVDLDLIDIRPPIKHEEIRYREYKFIVDDYFSKTMEIMSGLEQDKDPKQYKIKDSITSYLERTIDNPQKSHWNTAIQEYLKGIDIKTYDCISYNNVSGHIPSKDDREYIVQSLLSHLREKGVLITDSRYGGGDTLMNLPNFADLKEKYDLLEIAPGVFQRRK